MPWTTFRPKFQIPAAPARGGVRASASTAAGSPGGPQREGLLGHSAGQAAGKQDARFIKSDCDTPQTV